MRFSLGVVGVGQFGGQFAHLYNLHPGVSAVYVVDELPERAAEAVDLAETSYSLACTA